MVTLTVFGVDNTKQVTNMSDLVLLDEKKKELADEPLKAKMQTIAQSIGSKNYLRHKVRIS